MRNVIYPTADFKNGITVVYAKKGSLASFLFYDESFTDPVKEEDMSSLFTNGAVSTPDGIVKFNDFAPAAIEGFDMLAAILGSTTLVYVAGENEPQEDIESDDDNGGEGSTVNS